MYVYIYIYIYMAEHLRAANNTYTNNTYTQTYEYIYTHTLTFIYVCMYIRIYVYLKVAEELGGANLEVEVDLSANLLNKKIRTAQLAQFNYILVVGKEEVDMFGGGATLTVYMSSYSMYASLLLRLAGVKCDGECACTQSYMNAYR